MVEALGTTQLVAGDIAVIVIYFVIVLGFGLVVSNIFKSICFNENCDIWIAFLLKFASSYSIDNMPFSARVMDWRLTRHRWVKWVKDHKKMPVESLPWISQSELVSVSKEAVK